YHESKKWNDRFGELEVKKDQLDRLEQQQTHYAEKEKTLQLAERASYITGIENLFHELRTNEHEKKELLKTATRKKMQAEQAKLSAEQAFNEQQELQGEREKLREQVLYFEKLLPAIKELAHKKEKLALLEKEAEQSEIHLKQAEKEFNAQKEEKQKLDGQIAELEEVLETVDETQQKLASVTEKYRVAGEYVSLKQQRQQQEAVQEAKKSIYEQANTAYRDLEAQ